MSSKETRFGANLATCPGSQEPLASRFEVVLDSPWLTWTSRFGQRVLLYSVSGISTTIKSHKKSGVSGGNLASPRSRCTNIDIKAPASTVSRRLDLLPKFKGEASGSAKSCKRSESASGKCGTRPRLSVHVSRRPGQVVQAITHSKLLCQFLLDEYGGEGQVARCWTSLTASNAKCTTNDFGPSVV